MAAVRMLVLIKFYGFCSGRRLKPSKHFNLDAKSPEVQGIAQHFRQTIRKIKDGTWRHYGSYWQGGRVKKIIYPGHKDAKKEWLAPGAMEFLQGSDAWADKEFEKALDRIKRIFFRDDMEPFHNKYRELSMETPAYTGIHVERGGEGHGSDARRVRT